MKLLSKIIISSAAGICFILIVSFGSQSINTEKKDPDSIKVMSYNIHQGFDNSGKIDPRKFLIPIQKANPDIIGLQETETNRLIAGNYDITFWLAKKLNMHYYYGPPTKKQIYGVSILSKFPLKNTKTTYLESTMDQRVLVEATITHNKKDINIHVVHLGLSVEDRYNQIKWLYDNRVKNNSSPLLLLGDFNTDEFEDFTTVVKPADNGDGFYENRLKVYERRLKENKEKNISAKAIKENFKGLPDLKKYLSDSWRIKNPQDVLSFTWFDTNEDLGIPKKDLAPSVRIDYIFTSNHFAVLESKIIKDKSSLAASDHLPVISTVKLK